MSLLQRTIGRTGLAVTTLGFGGGPLGGMYTATSDTTALATIEAAYDGGLRYFDTAPFYGHGLSEHRVGQALRKAATRDFVLSSKVGRLLRPVQRGAVAEPSMFVAPLPFNIEFDYSYDGIMRSVEDSFQRLGVNEIDILLLHDVNRRWHGDEIDRRFDEVMNGGYRALAELRRTGAIHAFGVGVNDAGILVRFARSGDFDCFMLAARYTLLEQDPLDELLPLCTDMAISILIAAPFASGILATGAKPGATYFYSEAPADIMDKARKIEAVCARHGVPLPAAALQFPLGHSAVASVVPGFRSPDEVANNLAHFKQAIPSAFWQELKAQKLIRADAPVPS
jgi:D-threo-aldose 1-dehydrogenase